MAAYLNPRVLDLGLNVLDTEADILHLCSAQPANFAGIAAVSLANKTGIAFAAPTDRSPTGRKVIMAAIEAGDPGDVTATGSATHYAIADTVNSRLLVANALANPQALTNGNTFILGPLTVGIPAPD